jgi:hypothetical protein
MNYYNLSKYIESVLVPYILVNQILYLYKHNALDISFIKLYNKIKKIINIRNINYHKVKHITNNILITKYNYKIISYKPLIISYVVKQ